ncbi:MAG: hypothetical protein LLF89_08890 [Spirochaetaceae bacterium]|nr:hypothetical protein [Spirochaetaceae bacterium]
MAISDRNSTKLRSVAGAFVSGFKAMGHDTEIFFNADARLSLFDFVVICSEPKGIGSDIGFALPRQLSQGGSLAGKRAMAVVARSGLMPNKALQKLMALMEKEGLFIVQSQLIGSASQVLAAVHAVPLERP